MPNLSAFLGIAGLNTVPLLAVLALGDAQFVRFPAALGALAILFLLRHVLLRLLFAPFLVLNRIAGGAVSVSHISKLLAPLFSGEARNANQRGARRAGHVARPSSAAGSSTAPVRVVSAT